MPSYANPAARMRRGIEHVAPVDQQRPSASSSRTASQSTSASCGHSVTITAASAPAAASSTASATCSTPSSPRACATGSQHAHVRALGEQASREHEAGASRTSSVFGLKARPSSAIVVPRSEPELLRELADHAALLELVHLDHRVQQLEVIPRVCRELLQGQRVFREARAAEADAGPQEARADPAVEPDRLRRPCTTSAPVASQTFAISLMKEIRVIRAALAASLTISAEATSQRTIGASIPSCSALDASPSSVLEGADDDPVGMHEVAQAVPSAVNSGFEA